MRILGKHRTDLEWLTIPPATVRALMAWLEVRGSFPGPFFYRIDRASAREGPYRPLTGKSIERLVADLAARSASTPVPTACAMPP